MHVRQPQMPSITTRTSQSSMRQAAHSADWQHKLYGTLRLWPHCSWQRLIKIIPCGYTQHPNCKLFRACSCLVRGHIVTTKNGQKSTTGYSEPRLDALLKTLAGMALTAMLSMVCIVLGSTTSPVNLYGPYSTDRGRRRRNFTSFVQPTSLLGCGRVQGPHQK